MKVNKMILRKIEIPMTTSFTTSFGTIDKKPTIIVEAVTDEGIIGFGEAAAMSYPFYNSETVDTSLLVLKDYIGPLVLNKEIKKIEDLWNILIQIKGNNFAKTGIETAFWAVSASKEKKSLTKLLGGNKSKIAVGESIGIKKTVKETIEEVQLRVDQGFQRIKLKIQPGWDIEITKRIREKFGEIDLMVDGNSAYTLGDIEVFKALDNLNLTMIEQPLAYDDIVDHAVLQKEIKTPICLDESIHSAEDARKAISIGACKIINIKPGRVGGLLESKKIHDLCQGKNVGVWCGGMLETGIGRAFNIALASLPNFIYPADMSPVNFYYKDDLVKDSFVVDSKGEIKVSDKDGLGYEIDKEKLKKYQKEEVVLI